MLAIAGGKGGAGKTTTTLGLAAAMEGPVLAVDADVDMPDLHAMAGVDRTPTLAAGDAEAARAHPDHPGVSVLPAPERGAVPERERDGRSGDSDPRSRLGPGPGRESVPDVARALSRLDAGGTTVLVDCPAGASRDAVAPLRVADGVLLVSTLCAPSLRDAAKTAAMARRVGTPVVGAVLTRTRLRPDAVGDLLACPVLAAVPDAPPPVLDRRAVRASYARLAERTQEEELIPS